MSTEHEHLIQLRASLRAIQDTGGDAAALREAVELLLQIAIAHHETVGLGVPDEEVPPFMETGEPIFPPTVGKSGQTGG